MVLLGSLVCDLADPILPKVKICFGIDVAIRIVRHLKGYKHSIMVVAVVIIVYQVVDQVVITRGMVFVRIPPS